MGMYVHGCSIPTGALFSFFFMLETSKKLMKNDFSSVAEKKEHVPEKYLFNDFRGCSF
jgi:hypothetical protein